MVKRFILGFSLSEEHIILEVLPAWMFVGLCLLSEAF